MTNVDKKNDGDIKKYKFILLFANIENKFVSNKILIFKAGNDNYHGMKWISQILKEIQKQLLLNVQLNKSLSKYAKNIYIINMLKVIIF